MVVFSFYRGNLHRVPDIPRRWPVPKPTISVATFRRLLHKRQHALNRLQLLQNHHDHESPPQTQPEPEPEPLPEPKAQHLSQLQAQHDSIYINCNDNSSNNNNNVRAGKRKRDEDQKPYFHEEASKPDQTPPHNAENAAADADNADACTDMEMDVDMDSEHPPPQINTQSQVHSECASQQVADLGCPKNQALPDHPPAPKPQPCADSLPSQQKPADANSEKIKRKLQLEAKLKELTEEKHHLVQMLKQILSNEEEMKKRSQLAGQSSGSHAFLAHGEIVEGFQSRQPIRNANGDLEEGELEDAFARSPHSHAMHHAYGLVGSIPSRPHNSQQPSQSSHAYRAGLTIGNVQSQHNSNILPGMLPNASPLRMYGNQGQHMYPPLTIPATQAAMSSPSPAGSVGISIFRDTRLPSPTGSGGGISIFRDTRLPSPTIFRDTRLPSPTGSGGGISIFRDTRLPSPSWNQRS